MPFSRVNLERNREAERVLDHQNLTETSDAGPPVLYAPNTGTISAKIHRDKEGKSTRILDEHRYRREAFPCTGPLKCRVCNRHSSLATYDNNMLRQYGPRRLILFYATILKAEGLDPKSQRHLILGQPVLFVGDRSLDQAFDLRRSVLASEGIHSLFTDDEADILFKITFRPRGRLNLSREFIKPSFFPPLPDHFPPLSQCIYPQGVGPEQSKVDAFVERMEAASLGKRKSRPIYGILKD